MKICTFSLFDESPVEVVAYRGPVNAIGTYQVRAPDQVSLPSPMTISAVLTAVRAYQLSSNPLFTNSEVADDYTPAGWDTTGCIASSVGSMGSTFLSRTASPVPQLLSTTRVLASTPAQALLLVDAFKYQDTDPKAGIYTRAYATFSETSAELLCEASFNGGGTYVTVTPNSVVSIPVPDQGSSLLVRFKRNSGTDKLYLAAWTLLY
jgi:hypothetical protein